MQQRPKHARARRPLAPFWRKAGICLMALFLFATFFAMESDVMAASSSTYRLEVSVSKQRVYAYNRKSGKLVRSMICSTGKSATPTPKGTYKISSKARWYYFTKFNCYAQYMSRFNGPYLFHSVLYRKKDTSTLVQSSVNNLGSRASHGCVRLRVSDAKWIYNNCKSGTQVKVKG